MFVNVHENHEQVYKSFIENKYFVTIMEKKLVIFVIHFIPMHKLSRVIFLDPLFIYFILSLQGLFYMEI